MLLGPGTGKSVFLKSLIGLRPERGSILIDVSSTSSAMAKELYEIRTLFARCFDGALFKSMNLRQHRVPLREYTKKKGKRDP